MDYTILKKNDTILKGKTMAEYNHRGLEDFRSNIYQFDRYHYNDYLLQPRPCHNIAVMLEGRARFTEDGAVTELGKTKLFLFPGRHGIALSGLETPILNFIRCILIFPGKTILCAIKNLKCKS